MGCTVLPIWPKQAQFAEPFGKAKLGVLKMLNISARNWRFLVSVSLKLRMMEKSQSATPGPVRIFRPAFPKVYGAGTEKAAGFVHCAVL